MATSTSIPVSEYLSTVYRPDCDYVDGEVQERSLGEYDHGDLQAEITTRLRLRSKEWGIRVIPELRVQVGPTRFRIPDVCAMSADEPKEQIVRRAPLLCIEVLSPEDRMSRVQARIEDFLAMGVREVWVFDPQKRTVAVWNGATPTEYERGELRLLGTEIVLDVTEVFAVLDEA